MATMDNFFQALGMFDQATKEYAVKSGIDEATKAVQGLSQQKEIDYVQRTQLQGQIANQLQAQLAGLGAPQSQIAAAVGTIAPPQINSAQSAFVAAQRTTDPQERAALLKQAKDFNALEAEPTLIAQRENFGNQKSLEQMRLSSQERIAGLKASIGLDEDKTKRLGQLSSQYEEKTAPLRAALQQADRAFTLLNSNNPVADTASLNALVKASGDSGVITESDRAAFGGSKAFLAKLARAEEQFTSGKLDEDNRKFLLQVAETYKSKADKNLAQYADRFSDRAVNLVGVGKDKALSVIDPDVYKQRQQQAQSSASQPAKPSAPAGQLIKVRVNGKTGQISESQWDLFKAKNPTAERM